MLLIQKEKIMMTEREKGTVSKLSTALDQQSMNTLNIIFDLEGILFDPSTSHNKSGASSLHPADLAKTAQLLHDCIAQGHRLFVVSNWTTQWYQFFLADPMIARIFTFFDDIILSEQVGIQKPDPRIFSYLLTKHSLKPHRCIFLDKQESSLKGAQQVGITKGILCKNVTISQIREKLQSHGALKF